MESADIEEPIRQGQLRLGLTKADVRAVLGPPHRWGNTSRKYREPCIWAYGAIELWFERRPGRTPWPGPRLTGVYTENAEGDGRMLLG
jgi:hypothetical protein